MTSGLPAYRKCDSMSNEGRNWWDLSPSSPLNYTMLSPSVQAHCSKLDLEYSTIVLRCTVGTWPPVYFHVAVQTFTACSNSMLKSCFSMPITANRSSLPWQTLLLLRKWFLLLPSFLSCSSHSGGHIQIASYESTMTGSPPFRHM